MYPPEHGYPPAPSFPPVPAVYPPVPGCPAVRSYYHIRSRLNGLVLDVEGDNRNPGARIVMWNQKPGNCDNQLWYDDFATGTIRSKLNDFCLDWNGNNNVFCVHSACNFTGSIVSAEIAVGALLMTNAFLVWV